MRKIEIERETDRQKERQTQRERERERDNVDRHAVLGQINVKILHFLIH